MARSDQDTEGCKRIFARNVAQLVEVLPASQREAAEQIGVPYKWMRRMTSAGISRPDQRSRHYLDRLAAHFHLPSVEHFWHPDLVAWLLLAEEGKDFVRTYRCLLAALWRETEKKLRQIDSELLDALRVRLGDQAQVKRSDERYSDIAEKLGAILATGECDHIEKLIEDYYATLVEQRRQSRSGRQKRHEFLNKFTMAEEAGFGLQEIHGHWWFYTANFVKP